MIQLSRQYKWARVESAIKEKSNFLVNMLPKIAYLFDVNILNSF